MRGHYWGAREHKGKMPGKKKTNKNFLFAVQIFNPLLTML